MGLTADIYLRLVDAGLVKFYEDNARAFKEMAESAHEYAATYVAARGLPLRRDDVAKILVPALETTETLRVYLANHSLRTKNYYTFFADLILDQIWEDLQSDA
jgi:hypothetical protein